MDKKVSKGKIIHSLNGEVVNMVQTSVLCFINFVDLLHGVRTRGVILLEIFFSILKILITGEKK